MDLGADNDGRPDSALLVSNRFAEVHEPHLPRLESRRSGHRLYSGYSSAAPGSPSPAALSVSLASAW